MKLKLFILIPIFLFFASTPAIAKKKISRASKVSVASTDYGVWEKLKLRTDKNAILVVFGGMKFATAVNYNLTYTADDVPRGAQGSHDPEDGNTQKQLTFGTCSGNDCSYDQDITDMVFEITYQLESGKTLTKRYQINL